MIDTSETIQKQRRLVERLYAKTLDSTLAWSPGFIHSGYDTQIGAHVVNLHPEDAAFEDEPDYVILILDSVGVEIIDSFRDEDISESDLAPSVGRFNNYYHLLDSLFKIIARRATGADAALDNILDGLGN